MSPHPDDETFFLGGTIAHYAREHDVYLLVLSDGEQGNIAVELENGEITRRRPPPEEIEAFRQRRRQECLEAASILGVRQTTFLSYSDQSVPLLGVSGIRRALRAVDPHVVVSLSEAGTTMHPDHCWAALCIAEALRSLLREHYGRIPSDGVLPSEPPWAFRRWFTFTMPEAATRFDYFAELVSSENETVEIDVSAELDRVRRACLAYESQLHWLKFLERVKCDALPTQRFIERIAIGTSAGGKRSMLAPWGDSRKVFLDALPRAAVAYTSTEGSFFADLKSRERMFATWSMRGLILASGHGKRMGHPELPKSLVPLRGRPILEHIVGGLSDSLVDEAPIIVVGPRGDQIVSAFESKGHLFVDQGEPRGTGHAVLCALPTLQKLNVANVLIVLGDMPLFLPSTFQAIASKHLLEGNVITMGTCTVEDFEGWRGAFRSFGRILRDESDRVVRIQEAKEEGCDLSRTEVNPGLFCIQTAWLARVLPTLGSNNAQGEYYLTDLVERARSEGAQLATVSVPAEEVFGINTPVDLETAQTILIRREGRPERAKVAEIVD